MEQSFSHGLLYSVAPENLCELHLQDENTANEFEWEEQEPALGSLFRLALVYLKQSVSH